MGPLKKILFIDDDADIHFIIKMCLEDIPGVELCFALSGEEGIKKAMELHPDMILLDMMMPVMDGIATLRAFKLLPSVAKIPVVFFTARAQKSEIDEYLKMGALDVIVKPFDPILLADTIQQIWKKIEP